MPELFPPPQRSGYDEELHMVPAQRTFSLNQQLSVFPGPSAKRLSHTPVF